MNTAGLKIGNSESQDPITAQLNLGLGARELACRRPSYRRRQMLRARAKFWFDQMRRAVDNAVEWKPAPLPRPEQGAFDLRRRSEEVMAK